jgi:type I restriction enzyme M protein
MLTDTTLRSAVEALWDKLWSGGLANPLDAIEQLSFLLFLKRLDEREQDAERAAKLRGKKFTPIFPNPDLRWSHWTQLPADKALKHVKETSLSLHQDARWRGRLLRGPDGKRRVQDQ